MVSNGDRARHGGKRRGAGRTRALTGEQRDWVGRRCEALVRERAADRIGRKKHGQDWDRLRGAQDELRALKIQRRKPGSSSVRERRDDVTGVLKLRRRQEGDHAEDRVLRVEPSREDAYGIRPEIIARVVEDARTRPGGRGFVVTPRMVEKCWEAWRSVLADEARQRSVRRAAEAIRRLIEREDERQT